MSYFVLGNWKSNGTAEAVAEFGKRFAEVAPAAPDGVNHGLALPFHLLAAAGEGFGQQGAQNVSATGEGAYTGEITANMLKATGCSFSLIGHSERRQYFDEVEKDTAAKITRLLEAGLLPVLCIGETLEERNDGRLEEILTRHLEPVGSLPAGTELVVAYEPVWAIGTGVAAEPEDVEKAHTLVKGLLADKGFGETPVLYGGSVKPGNAATLGAIDKVDGFLVGGASLKADDFSAILKGFLEAKKLG